MIAADLFRKIFDEATVTIKHCPDCRQPIEYDWSAKGGAIKFHTDTGKFICPEE